MPIPQLSEAAIRRYASPQSFQRGQSYVRSEAVLEVVARGNLLLGRVQGNDVDPYQVSLSFEGNEIQTATCTCSYGYEGWCKHLVAVSLVALHQPEIVEQRPSLAKLLDRLDFVQTQGLIQALVAQQPELIDEIERHIHQLVPQIPQTIADPKPRRIDPAPFRRKVKQILREAVRYFEEEYAEDDPIPEEIIDLIQEAQVFTDRGDGNSAIVILEAITAACVEEWDEVEEYGADNGEIACFLNEAWTEAILTAELPPPEKVDLQVNLESWQDEWRVDFAMSLVALHQGWDDPALQRILQGNIKGRGMWGERIPPYAEDLALIRLKILERQERYEEYLYLAQAEGQTKQYLTMLVELGRAEEAIAATETQMRTQEEAFALARRLQQQDQRQQALEIAEKGLALPGKCEHQLCIWTSNLARELENFPLALSARLQAFPHSPDLGEYRLIESWAGEQWPEIKAKLLKAIPLKLGWQFYPAKVEIYLAENLLDEAIAIVDQVPYDTRLTQRVMKQATATHPDWVIAKAIRPAEQIIDRKKSEAYDEAVEWLKLAKSAYLAADRAAEWSAYYTQLKQTHARKPKLMALLQKMDRE